MGCTALVAMAATSALADSGKDEAKIRRIAFDYASCVVRKHHDKASEAILATASNHAITHQMTQIIDSDCLGAVTGLGVDMRFPHDTYRFALADALVNVEFAFSGPASFNDRLPLAQPSLVSPEDEANRLDKAKDKRRRADEEKEIGRQNALAWMAKYGECVVRADPADARYWLLTPADRPEETSRIKAMQPAFASCLGAGTMHFNRTLIRGTVAVNYYRLARATVMPGTGGSTD